ncbi:response regulator [Candidatus Peribacteria bacterium]|jgi:DNA-binding response OmpR family regulator|nr:response regulator [Candidatus Peribacteria bacterium]MBT4021708.1 response regulator [Candidatus Peribacteria bacterium]MBT4241171.1 response regulator [Candidatus Peribacteria bacterium]MBT4473924.1 response regulator [Candidatus Peribacteria bacterium]
MDTNTQNPAPEEQKNTSNTTSPEQSGSSGKRILIVEDEKPLSHALKLKLSHEGYDAEVANDGEEGFTKASSGDFDLVLVDIIMPKMDGFTMLAKLQESGSKTKIIVLSNLGQQEDVERAKELGVFDYMVKSNTPISRIVEAVKSAVS